MRGKPIPSFPPGMGLSSQTAQKGTKPAMIASLPCRLYPESSSARNLTTLAIQTATIQTDVRLTTLKDRGRAISFRILPTNGPAWTPGLKDHPNLYPSGRLRPTAQIPYQLIRQTWQGTSRRVNAVCWHGHRDFLARLFTILPDLTVRTARATYRGLDNFHQTFPLTDINIGSNFQPLLYSDACNCSSYIRTHIATLNTQD